MLFDNPILKKDEFVQRTRAEHNEQHVREQQLTAAGAAIRQIAVTRKRRSVDVDDLVEVETPKKKTRRSSSSVLVDVSASVVEIFERQKESDERKL